MDKFKTTQYACAVLLILSSIALAFLQTLMISDIAGGVLIYIAQAFLLAGSIFGLDYYVKKLTKQMSKSSRHPLQQSPQHPHR